MKSKMEMKTLNQFICRNVDISKSTLITNKYNDYNGGRKVLAHIQINHSYEYANSEIHTCINEGFWTLVKRGIIGQYHKMSTTHLYKYLNEFIHRFNNRNTSPLNLIKNTLCRIMET